MNITQLFEMQKVLDDRIIKEHGLEGKDLLQERILALNVELAELAQETRCFKFWSKNQQPSDRVLDELVDVLHFMLSVTLDYGDEHRIISEFEDPEQNELIINLVVGTEITVAFNNLFESIQYADVLNSWINFVDLYLLLGFTWDQVTEAYMEKNKENHARQDRGY